MRTDLLESESVQNLATLIEEAARSTAEGVKYFVEPASGSLRRATSRRPHLVFGRRGSGKSSLLRKAAADLTVDRRPIAWVDLEPFKGHSYPDLLLSVLIATFKEFHKWLDTAAVAPSTKTSFWKKLFGTSPSRKSLNKKSSRLLKEQLKRQIDELETQLHAVDKANIHMSSESQQAENTATNVGAKLGSERTSVSAGSRISRSQKDTASVSEDFKRDKVEFLKRHVMEYQAIFDEMAKLSNGSSYLFLDDLYHVRRQDQARVLDYFHSVAKNHNLWLKVGTIRHRSDWYVHGAPPIGIKIGDDADEIDLDLTLEKYDITKSFLLAILMNFLKEMKLNPNMVLTSEAIDRLVLASGGVARDFLSIFRKSIDVARERGGGARGPRIGAEDINIAAGEYDTTKRAEFKRDVYDEDQAALDKVFEQIRQFCLEKAGCNCFLIDKEKSGEEIRAIHELVDVKLLHLIRARVTMKSSAAGKIYEAYMLDLSQYAGSRKRRGLELIEFWKPGSKEKLRRASLIHPIGK